ncbi:hypothetical protein HanIR_MTg0917171 (mitochondrion) [Helianthus annuus]|nr:hypothetical protein HanIR_MTg0917171 [Helianthus annuus]
MDHSVGNRLSDLSNKRSSCPAMLCRISPNGGALPASDLVLSRVVTDSRESSVLQESINSSSLWVGCP